MSRIKVRAVIEREPAEVWADLRDIATHVTWMSEAVEIRFLTEQRAGVGTRFECDTKVGPIRLTDEMEITGWDEGRSMAVRHTGLVAGDGVLSVGPADGGGSLVRWEEELSFPLRLGGALGAQAGRPVLRWIWKRNLARLRRRLGAGLDRGEEA